MLQDKLVTIIVPIYDVEKYLPECIESLIHQTYTNLEILLIDDESPDKCPEICEQYAKKDNRIKVIHKKNGGAASARNTGMEKVTGEYVCFVDSDDYVSLDFVQRLVEEAEKYKADIAACSFESLYLNRKEKNEFKKSLEVYVTKEYLKLFLVDWSCALAWNKIFRAQLLKNIRFEEGHKIDDEFFTYKVVMQAKKIVHFNEPLYKYRMRVSGVMKANEGRDKRFWDQVEFIERRYQVIRTSYPDLKSCFMEHMADNYIQFFRSDRLNMEIAKYIKECIRKHWSDFLFVPYKKNLKIWIMVYMLYPIKMRVRNKLWNSENEITDDLFE